MATGLPINDSVGVWIPACAGMTIYSRCVDTYAQWERESRYGLRPQVHG